MNFLRHLFGVPSEFGDEFRADLRAAEESERQYLATGNILALDQAVASWQRILASPSFPERPMRVQLAVLNNAGGLFLRRYWRQRQLADLDRALALWQQAVAAAPADAPDLPGYLTNLGIGLRARYGLREEDGDLDTAIDAWQQAIALMPSDVPSLPSLLTKLATGLRVRYIRHGQEADLDAAISAWQQAVALTPTAAPERASRLNNLGIGLRDSYARHRREANLPAAIDAWQQAVALLPAVAHERAAILNNLGNGLRDRYEWRGQAADLEAAISAWQQAVVLTPADVAERASRLNNLGVGLRARYAQHGQEADLNAAISAWQQAVALTRADAAEQASIHNNLGVGLRDRYMWSGEEADLDAAIDAFQQVVTLTPADAPDMAMRLTNLGTGLRDRYMRRGMEGDLDAAIVAWQRAVALTPPAAPDLARHLASLASGLRARYTRHRQDADLNAAIVAWQRAVTLTLPAAPDLAGYLTDLGTGLNDRYRLHGEKDDLDAAIAAWQQAVALTPTNAPVQAVTLTNLGAGLRDRYIRYGEEADLNAAIAVSQQAVTRTPIDAPGLAARLTNLGNALRDRYVRHGQVADLEAGIAVYRHASQRGSKVAPAVAHTSARIWSEWAAERAAWKEVTEACGYGIESIHHLYRSQLLRIDKESWLRDAQGLHARAAYALAKLGQNEDALVVLERGRARLLGEVLARDHADLEALRATRNDLLERYRASTARLRTTERDHSPRADRDTVSHTDPRAAIQAAREELDAVIEEIRHLPGYTHFLQEPDFNNMDAVLPGVPLVYLVTTPQGSVTLIIHRVATDGTVDVGAQWVDDFKEDDLNTFLVQREGAQVTGGYLPGQLGVAHVLEQALEAGLPIVGTRLLQPLAAYLRALGAVGVVLVPVGRLALLPLHAAPYRVEDETRCLLDEFDVAYAPSAQVLSILHREATRRTTAVATLIGVGNSLADLATATWAQQELQRLRPALQRLRATLPAPAAAEAGTMLNPQALLDTLLALTNGPTSALCHAGRILQDGLRLCALVAPSLAEGLRPLAARILPSLRYARVELSSVADLFPVGQARPYFEQAATRDALWAALPGATVAHFACHGQFDPTHPLNSGLMLAANTRLTLSELLGAGEQLSTLRLVVLSACQTAITDFQNVPDEVVGLPAGFLQAGVPAVVGSLWSVDDLSTALLMVHFHELLWQGDIAAGLPPQPPGRALRLAQVWLRDLTYEGLNSYLQPRWIQFAEEVEAEVPNRMAAQLTEKGVALARRAIRQRRGAERPYAHPYHWAAFVFNGVL